MTRLSALIFLHEVHRKAVLLAAALLSLTVTSPGQAMQIEVVGDQIGVAVNRGGDDVGDVVDRALLERADLSS